MRLRSDRSQRTTRAVRATFSILALAALSGCASPQMKGTPFYTGEHSIRQGPAADRVNLWPLLYYRKPALSVLWPIVELTDEHFAVRPIMSVYGLDREDKVYNVLWPLASFDTQTHRHRVFPVFWGEDYCTVFPLYWHHRSDRMGGSLSDGFFPLWWYKRDKTGHDLHVGMPVFHKRRREDAEGWRVWPLVGSYREKDDRYAFLLWPLGHKWKRGQDKGSMFFPVYQQNSGPAGDRFLSLPYSFGRGSRDDDWDLVFPLFYRRDDRLMSCFVTPLYSQGHSKDGHESWNLLLPFYYRAKSRHDDTFATLLGGYEKKGATLTWLALPLLSGGEKGEGRGSVWALGPLAHWEWDGGKVRQHVFPLFYRSRDRDGSLFVSLPWSSGSDSQSKWQLVPPFMFRRQTRNGDGVLATPVYSAGRADGGRSRWHTVFPLYYLREGEEGKVLATLLGGVSRDAGGRKWLVYPLLSGGRKGGDGGEVWVVAPLFHAKWDEKGVSHHLLPVYYWDGRRKTFVSPVAAKWRDGRGRSHTLVPPALSLFSSGERRKDLWAAAGLAHFSWGEEAGPQHVFPLYYRNPETGTFVSPIYSGWRDGTTTHRVFPLLLSGYSRNGGVIDVTALLGLFRNHWEEEKENRWGYMAPLYYYGDETFYTLLFGWNRGRKDGFFYPLTPLVGFRRGDCKGGWLFPLFSHRRDIKTNDTDGTFLWGTYERKGRHFSSQFVPLYSYTNHGSLDLTQTDGSGAHRMYGREFTSLPACWYRNQLTTWPEWPDGNRAAEPSTRSSYNRAHGCFPFWSYSHRSTPHDGKSRTKSTVLLALYDYLRESSPDVEKQGEIDDYVRSRVLWRLWHYERANDSVSVDVFPGITYDRRGDAFKKVSFLWRALRYERDGRQRDLDVLFMPFKREIARGEDDGAEDTRTGR